MSLDLIILPFANGGDKTAPPQTSPSGFVNFEEGYNSNYEIDLDSGDPQAKAVERQVQNYMFNQLTEIGKQWQSLGFAPWFAGMPGGYSLNAIVMRQNGGSDWIPYRSLVNTNSTDPLSSPGSWEYVRFGWEMLASIPMQTGGTAGPSAEVVTAATNLNSFTTGTWEFQSDAVVSGSTNAPASSAGMLESKTWVGPTVGNTYSVQRYFARNGRIYGRVASNGSWTSWFTVANMANVAMPAGGTDSANELVTVATDFNTFASGTYQYQTDAIANGSTNKPSPLAGVLECKAWVNGGTTYTMQRYVDRNANVFVRTASNTTWTQWYKLSSGEQFSGYNELGVTTVLATAALGQMYLLTAAGLTLTLPAIAGCPAGTTITVAAPLGGTLKGNSAESIADLLGTAANTYAMNPGDIVKLVSKGTSWVTSSLSVLSVLKDSATGAAWLPVGTNAQRPAALAGRLRFNSDTGRAEIGNGTAFVSLGGATGGGNDAVFYLNDQTVNNDYSIPSGQNAMTAGPVTIANGKTVTIPNGSFWTVV